jgi:hypothetical protein
MKFRTHSLILVLLFSLLLSSGVFCGVLRRKIAKLFGKRVSVSVNSSEYETASESLELSFESVESFFPEESAGQEKSHKLLIDEGEFKRKLDEIEIPPFDARFLSLFIADEFAPVEYDGGNEVEICEKLKMFFQSSHSCLELFGTNKEHMEMIEKTLKDAKSSIELRAHLAKRKSNLAEKINELKVSSSFKEWKNSFVMKSGTSNHAIICEFMKVKVNKENCLAEDGREKIAILVYNSGEGLDFHFQRFIDGKKSSVL